MKSDEFKRWKGVPWAILAVDFEIATGRPLPINLGKGSRAQWTDAEQLPELRRGQTLADKGMCLQGALCTLATFFQGPLWPGERTQVNLAPWGLNAVLAGLSIRPRLVAERAVTAALWRHLAEGTSRKLDQVTTYKRPAVPAVNTAEDLDNLPAELDRLGVERKRLQGEPLVGVAQPCDSPAEKTWCEARNLHNTNAQATGRHLVNITRTGEKMRCRQCLLASDWGGKKRFLAKACTPLGTLAEAQVLRDLHPPSEEGPKHPRGFDLVAVPAIKHLGPVVRSQRQADDLGVRQQSGEPVTPGAGRRVSAGAAAVAARGVLTAGAAQAQVGGSSSSGAWVPHLAVGTEAGTQRPRRRSVKGGSTSAKTLADSSHSAGCT